MRLPIKSGFAMATLVAASFAFAGVTQAASLAGMADTVTALQKEATPHEMDGMIQKAHSTGKPHTHRKGKS